MSFRFIYVMLFAKVKSTLYEVTVEVTLANRRGGFYFGRLFHQFIQPFLFPTIRNPIFIVHYLSAMFRKSYLHGGFSNG